MPQLPEHQGERFKYIVKQFNVKRVDLAKLLEMSDSNITYLYRKKEIPLIYVVKLMEHLNLDVADYFPELAKEANLVEYVPKQIAEDSPPYQRLNECERELLDLHKKYSAVLEENRELRIALSSK